MYIDLHKQLFRRQNADDTTSANFRKKVLSPCFIILKIEILEGNRLDLDEPPHPDLHCYKFYLLSSVALKELNQRYKVFISELDFH